MDYSVRTCSDGATREVAVTTYVDFDIAKFVLVSLRKGRPFKFCPRFDDRLGWVTHKDDHHITIHAYIPEGQPVEEQLLSHLVDDGYDVVKAQHARMLEVGGYITILRELGGWGL